MSPSMRVLAGTAVCVALGGGCGGGSGGGTGAPGTAVATASAAPAEAPLPPGVPAVAARGAEPCAECHATIVAEWRTSMHARSMRETDPLYALMFDKAVAALGEGARKKCSGCHYPEWADAAKAAGLPVEGVSCAVCHELPAAHPENKLESGEVARFARGDGKSARGLCMTCHAELLNPEGYPVCTTGAEADEAVAKGPPCMQTCLSCHMAQAAGAPASTKPVKSEHASHGFPGAHVREFLARRAFVELAVRGKGAKRVVDVTIRPIDVGHGLPTGNPMRWVALHVQGLDADGKVVWDNLGDLRPPVDRPEALFARVFSDAEGNRPVPPFLAKGPSADSRIPPLAARTVSYPVPAGARTLWARVVLGLGPPKILAAAGLTPAEAEPVVLGEARLDL